MKNKRLRKIKYIITVIENIEKYKIKNKAKRTLNKYIYNKVKK